MANPLSIKYKPGFAIRYGWCGMSDSMESLVKEIGDMKKGRLHVREALLQIYMNDEVFREALTACSDIDANSALFELDDVKEEAAQAYMEELDALRRESAMCREAAPWQMLDFISEACEKDSMLDPITMRITGGHYVKRLTALGQFNNNYLELVKFFLELYGENVVAPSAASGTPCFLTPVTFVGWGGPDSIGQTFSFLPEMIEEGLVEIECDKWGGWHEPHIIADWSSGVKIAGTEKKSVILKGDKGLIKSEVPIAGNTVPVSSCGSYLASIEECGEFTVNIYYRSKDMSERILVYTHWFCCK